MGGQEEEVDRSPFQGHAHRARGTGRKGGAATSGAALMATETPSHPQPDEIPDNERLGGEPDPSGQPGKSGEKAREGAGEKSRLSMPEAGPMRRPSIGWPISHGPSWALGKPGAGECSGRRSFALPAGAMPRRPNVRS